MTRDDGQDRGLSPEERKALDAVRGLPLPEPTADEAARARAAFLRGVRADDAATPGPVPEPGSAAAARPRPRDPRSRRGGWLAMAAVLAVALVTAWWGTRPADRWVVTEVVGPQRVSLESGDAVAGAVLPGGTIATGDSAEFEVQLGDRLRLRLIENTEIRLPRPPGRWFVRNRSLAVDEGEVYGTTDGPLGFALTLESPQVTVILTGTTFSVQRLEGATCICLWEGSVQIFTPDGATHALEPKNSVVLFEDGREPSRGPLDARETMKLSMIKDQGMVDPLPERP